MFSTDTSPISGNDDLYAETSTSPRRARSGRWACNAASGRVSLARSPFSRQAAPPLQLTGLSCSPQR